MRRMNTLIIAPSSDSQAEAEILALTLNGVLVNNYVTRGDVVAAVMHRRWDLVWFVGHGTSTGVLLSNGSIDTADLTALIRNSGAHTVVLNTCDSAAVARQLQRELGVTVIATIGAVGEPTAYQTGVLFAQNLAREMSIPAAFELARPGSGATYVMVGGEKKKDERRNQQRRRTAT
jgi:hypothetical protein